MAKKIAMALGGGGVRGLAHIGALEVLIEHGIKPDVVVGTSAGSIIGALYCDNPDIELIKEKMLEVRRQDVMHFSLMSTVMMFSKHYTPMSLDKLVDFLKKNLSSLKIEDFKVKYAAVATDMVTHSPYIFDSGDVIEAVLASTALPPVFSPRKFKDMVLVDGGITHPVPVEIARKYDPDIVIAVNINSPSKKNDSHSILDLSVQAFTASYYSLSVEQSKQADFTIHPDLRMYDIFSDAYNREIYELGRAEALKIVPNILASLQG